MQMLQAQLEVGTDPREVGKAREWARSRLAGFGVGADESLVETLVLLVSELVTNAVVHTGRPALLRIVLSGCLVAGGGTARIEVVDTSSRPPRRRRAEEEETSGRGLELVCGLADRWGWRQEGAGKRIWCELDRGHGTGTAGTGAVDAGDTGRAAPAETLLGDAHDRERTRAVRT
ncbi:ATP-binding protein [Streptomyces macrosporus]|uniref:Histidine kinase/HSP90-like ATPase domain-containing protein n=1 Tax=Streptomyces macrosporus TaxID=44032 RepID=A0ABN3JBQ9_9ACTN